MTELDAEDAKLVVLARGAMGAGRDGAAGPRCAISTDAPTQVRPLGLTRCG